MTTLSRRVLAAGLLAPILMLLAALPSRADGPSLSFSPNHGSANSARWVSFSGFGNDEAVALSFQSPSGQIALVGDDIVFWASSQSDGTGAFDFTPGDWLSPLQGGTWTVTMVGADSGLTATATLTIGD